MATKRVFLVFVLPVILSIVFGTAVLSDVLQKSDRELNMLPMSFSDGGSSHNTSIEIIGLSKQYSTSEPVEIQVKISDSSYSCGDLYITVYSSGKNDVITQGGFFEQCFDKRNELIPIGEKFSKVIDTAGTYKIVAEMISEDLKNISVSEEFTVK